MTEAMQYQKMENLENHLGRDYTPYKNALNTIPSAIKKLTIGFLATSCADNIMDSKAPEVKYSQRLYAAHADSIKNDLEANLNSTGTGNFYINITQADTTFRDTLVKIVEGENQALFVNLANGDYIVYGKDDKELGQVVVTDVPHVEDPDSLFQKYNTPETFEDSVNNIIENNSDQDTTTQPDPTEDKNFDNNEEEEKEIKW